MLNSSCGQQEIDQRLDQQVKKIRSSFDCDISHNQNIDDHCKKQTDSPKTHSIENQSKSTCTGALHCSGTDIVVQSSQQNSKVVVKLCALYKPLLRRFRSYFRESFEKQQAPSSTYQHWTEDQYIMNCKHFMRYQLKVSEDLLTDDSALKMLFFILPNQSRRMGSPEHQKDKGFYSRVF